MKNSSRFVIVAFFFFTLMLFFRLSHAQPNVVPDGNSGPWSMAASNRKGPGNNNGNGNGNSPCDNPNPPKWCASQQATANVPIEGPQMIILVLAGVGLGVMAIRKMKLQPAA